MVQEVTLLKSGEEMIIRKARPSDAAVLNAYLRQVADETTFLSFDASEWTKTDDEEAIIIQDYINTVNKTYFIALIDNDIVAHINAAGSQKKRLRHNVEFGVSILKDHWHKGIGTLLINKLIFWAKSNPIVRKINLMVSAHNTRAILLYRHLGFEYQGRIKNDNYVDGKYYDGISMGMWLG